MSGFIKTTKDLKRADDSLDKSKWVSLSWLRTELRQEYRVNNTTGEKAILSETNQLLDWIMNLLDKEEKEC